MKDINNPITKAYFTALNGNIPHPDGSGPVKVYEGQEPDNELANMYIVIQDVSSSDISTKSSFDHNAQIQLSVHSWKNKYNNNKWLNQVAGLILEVVHPTPASTIQTDSEVKIITTHLQQDNTTEYGEFSGRVFISRNLIFSHLVSY